MTLELAEAELRRAWQRFQSVFQLHNATVQAFNLLQAQPDTRNQLAVAILTRRGFDPSIDSDRLRLAVDDLMDAVAAEVDGGFQTVRGSALVAVCGAFEHLIKTRFVAFAASDPARAAASR